MKKNMISKVLFGVALIVLATTCKNPFFPGKNTADGEAPVISLETSNLPDTKCVEGEVITLTVGVEGDEDDFTYQWYSNMENSNEGGTPIYGATEPGFDPPTNVVGTKYYYVVITNKRNGKTTKSAPVKVTVNSVIIREIANNMLQITGGAFTMGSPSTEAGRSSNETQHSVTLTQSFKMSRFQVTQGQYQAVMGTNPSYFTTANGRAPFGGEIDERRPVEMVSWYDAIVFCNKLSVMEGLDPVYSISDSTNPDDWGAVPTNNNATWNAVVMVPNANGYRLPTEAEWEYACRAGTTTAFNDGNDDYTDATEVGKMAWYSGNAGSKTHQVGLKTPNAWGLYDMHGNVWEWCWDWYGTYASGAQTDPTGAVTGAARVIRGGYWSFIAQNLRSAIRDGSYPYFRDYHNIGFRLVRS
jgi:formylglycine-generating enzyme required for sulfatase activity